MRPEQSESIEREIATRSSAASKSALAARPIQVSWASGFKASANETCFVVFPVMCCAFSR